MATDSEKRLLNREERLFVERLAMHYTPTPMTATQRTDFDGALEERITRRSRPLFFRPATMVVTACTLALLWFISGYDGGVNSPDRTHQATNRKIIESVAIAENDSLLTYAYYDPELYGNETDEEEEDFLPDEYEALATAFVPSEG